MCYKIQWLNFFVWYSNDLIVYEESMIEHDLVSFYYVGLLEILRAKVKRLRGVWTHPYGKQLFSTQTLSLNSYDESSWT